MATVKQLREEYKELAGKGAPPWTKAELESEIAKLKAPTEDPVDTPTEDPVDTPTPVKIKPIKQEELSWGHPRTTARYLVFYNGQPRKWSFGTIDVMLKGDYDIQIPAGSPVLGRLGNRSVRTCKPCR